MATPVHIRLPTPMRVYIGAFGAVWLGGVTVGLVAALPRPESLIGVVMLGFGGVLLYRMLRLGVVADDEGLLVRNYLRTQRYTWDQVEDFRVGSPGFGLPVGKVIYVLLASGDITTLDVTMRWALLRRSRESLEAHHAHLREWAVRSRRRSEAG